MVCRHLRALEKALMAAGIPETSRGEAWSTNCREWVYFSCYLNRVELRKAFKLDPCVVDHEHRGTHDGCEAGFVCEVHNDGVMGIHQCHLSATGYPVFPGK
jgi:hypothetical protein